MPVILKHTQFLQHVYSIVQLSYSLKESGMMLQINFVEKIALQQNYQDHLSAHNEPKFNG